MNKAQPKTKWMCQNGFRGYSNVAAHSSFRIGSHRSSPQSLAAHALNCLSNIVKNDFHIDNE